MTEKKVRHVAVEDMTYGEYVEICLDRLSDVMDFFDVIEDTFHNKSVDATGDELIGQSSYIMESVAFLIEHVEDEPVQQRLLRSNLALEIAPVYEEKVGVTLFDSTSPNSTIAAKLASLLAQRVEDIVQNLIVKSLRQGITIHDKDAYDQLEWLDGFTQELWEYISDESIRPVIFISNADPFVEFELGTPRNENEMLARQIDSVGMITFGHAIGSAINKGSLSLEEIESQILTECDSALRPYLVALFEYFPEVVDRISCKYFNDTNRGNRSQFSLMVKEWAESHTSLNRPDNTLHTEVVDHIFLTRVEVRESSQVELESDFDNHPFKSLLPVDIKYSPSVKAVGVTIARRKPNVPCVDFVDVDHFELAHLQPSTGLQQSISIN